MNTLHIEIVPKEIHRGYWLCQFTTKENPKWKGWIAFPLNMPKLKNEPFAVASTF